MKNGATTSTATMMANAMVSLRLSAGRTAGAVAAMLAMAPRASQQTGRPDKRRVVGRGPEIAAEPGAVDDAPGAETDRERGDDHPGAIIRQKHEAEILPAAEQIRHHIGQTGGAVIIARDAFDDQREPEGE